MIHKIWKDLFASSLKEGLKIIDKEDIDQVVNMIVADKIDPQVFISNLEVLIQGHISLLNFKKPSPSVYYCDIMYRVRTFPLWFYAAYPDVMKWFHEWQKNYMRSTGFDDRKLSAETKKLLGVSIIDLVVQLIRKPKQHKPKHLKKLVKYYKDKTGRKLEVIVNEYSEGDIYTGAELLKKVGTESNFTFIAENTTKYYLELKRKYNDRFANETSILVVAGVLDAQGYISMGQIGDSELLDIAQKSTKAGEEALLEFIINLEIKLFEIDSPDMDASIIEEACNAQRRNIEKAIQKTKKEYTSESRFTSNTATFMELPQFKELRRKLGIKD